MYLHCSISEMCLSISPLTYQAPLEGHLHLCSPWNKLYDIKACLRTGPLCESYTHVPKEVWKLRGWRLSGGGGGVYCILFERQISPSPPSRQTSEGGRACVTFPLRWRCWPANSLVLIGGGPGRCYLGMNAEKVTTALFCNGGKGRAAGLCVWSAADRIGAQRWRSRLYSDNPNHHPHPQPTQNLHPGPCLMTTSPLGFVCTLSLACTLLRWKWEAISYFSVHVGKKERFSSLSGLHECTWLL